MRKFVFCLMFTPLAVSAADWRLANYYGISEGSEESGIYYIDSSTLDVSKNIRKAWMYGIRKDLKSGAVTSSKLQLEFNCKEKTTATLNFVSYKPSGAVSSSRTPKEKVWEAVIPESLGEGWLDFACSTKEEMLKHKIVNPAESSQIFFSVIEKPIQEEPPQ